MSGSSYYDDPKRRAEIDLLFLDIEHRIQQIREANARTAQLAVATAVSSEELRLSNRRFWVAAIAAGAMLVAAGGGLFAAGAAIWKQPTPIIIQVPR